MTVLSDIPVTTIPISARGPLSLLVLDRLFVGGEEPAAEDEGLVLAQGVVSAGRDLVHDDDVQLSLFLLYASHYGSLRGMDADREWDGELLGIRRVLEDAFEAKLRARVVVPEAPEPSAAAVAEALFALTGEDGGPGLARFIARKADVAQVREFLVHRSIYTLREADPHSWAIPRLTGRAKAALVEIQSDEYGGGRPERVHAELFARALRGAGLDDRYGAYVDSVPAVTLASMNTMSLFGLNRRLLGAIVGHLAAFEMTSSIPSRFYSQGLSRLGFGPEVADYYDEHVEADAVHEQIAGHDLAGALAEDRPELLPDILFGAAACLAADGWIAERILGCWEAGVSSLRGGAERDMS
ncbi:iron-containing redox enzyme family protein [Microbacterium bovistercoris]|uniref:iron-containing redox enzyme family protein n=1 Tax=Microbacterium bovistercoris TaxID=2293570 RepID=UPI001FE30DCB|nr:iron-containing redox enzyme family protein [Microbacterium bovistercoris]